MSIWYMSAATASITCSAVSAAVISATKNERIKNAYSTMTIDDILSVCAGDSMKQAIITGRHNNE